MSHDELSELLRSLPRAQATRGFTAATRARAQARRTTLPHIRKAAVALALSAIVLLSGAIGVHRRQEQVRLRQLRAEQQQIQRELEQLKALSVERQPRVFVAGSGSVDIVIGLDKRTQTSSAAAQPVSLHVEDDGIY